MRWEQSSSSPMATTALTPYKRSDTRWLRLSQMGASLFLSTNTHLLRQRKCSQCSRVGRQCVISVVQGGLETKAVGEYSVMQFKI